MIVAVQPSGPNPPLFLMHGVSGITPLSSTYARALGPQQPLYIVHANGIDGRQQVIDNMPELVRAYVQDIQRLRPVGPLLIGGVCEGSLAALEVARGLQEQGRQVGPVILGDPQPVPPGYDRRNYTANIQDPVLIRHVHKRVCEALLEHASRPYTDLPFDPNDPQQLDVAAAAGVATIIAFGRHVPRPYDGPVQLILSQERAPAFFSAQTPWQDLLRGPRMVHVVAWPHQEVFRSGREDFARALQFMIAQRGAWETPPEPQRASA